jgi:YD repeat-containing protein
LLLLLDWGEPLVDGVRQALQSFGRRPPFSRFQIALQGGPNLAPRLGHLQSGGLQGTAVVVIEHTPNSRSDPNVIATTFTYDKNSNVLSRTQLTLGNDANVAYEYDLANRLTKLTNHIDDANSIIFAYDNYDHVGNRLSQKIGSANEQVYDYDAVYRLTSVNYGDGNNTSFHYDALGNRHRTTGGGTVPYQTNSLNQYTAVARRQRREQCPVASYDYDYRGRRISKMVYGSPKVTIQYAYDGDRIIAEYDGSGTVLRKFVYGPGIDEPI